MGKIQVTEGTYTGGNIDELHLSSQHMLNPEKGFDKIIMYTEKRWLMTLLVSGVSDSRYTAPRMYGSDAVKTKIQAVPEGELIDGIAWKYKIMGRIQRAVEIVGSAVIGTTTSGTTTNGGFFSIALKDNYLQPGMNVIFHNGKWARCMGRPTGSAGYYIYRFQCYPGDTFVWATWVGSQPGVKTLFGGYSTFGERSLKGYDVVHYPNTFINHMTTQRKGYSLSGDANANKILWYNTDGGGKGFVYEMEAQSRARMLREDELQKWWGKSTMKDSNGNLLSSPSMIDEETGQPLYAGDGLIEQIRGANDAECSGFDGSPVYDDFVDLITQIKKKGNESTGRKYICVTGADGKQKAHDLISNYAANFHNITYNKNSNSAIGGDDIPVGYWFETLNVGGNQISFVENPLMDDEQIFPRRLSNGKLAMSSTFYFIDMSFDERGRRNVEIRARGREGVNRNLVTFWENGMTGEGKAESSVDAKRYEILKQNMLVIYNTATCAILEPSTTA